jgi:hypothetical protein
MTERAGIGMFAERSIFLHRFGGQSMVDSWVLDLALRSNEDTLSISDLSPKTAQAAITVPKTDSDIHIEERKRQELSICGVK